MAKDTLVPDVAPRQEAEIKAGTELLCENFETGGTVVGRIIGKDRAWVRLRIEDLGRDWIVRSHRIDLAKGSWQHVAADYPAIGEKKEFDAEFRPSQKLPATVVDAAAAKVEEFIQGLPEAMRAPIEAALKAATHRMGPAPEGAVYARWDGPGRFDGPYLDDRREMQRGARPGTTGFFPKASVEKFNRKRPGRVTRDLFALL